MTTIRYFIPEDGDLESQPNVFLAPKARQQGYPPTLAQVKNAFPLPGRYHFRFKTSLVPGTDHEKSALAVWMDCTDDRQPVMSWKSQVIAKVTRIAVEDEDDDDDDEDFRRPSPQVPPQQPRQPQQQQQTPPAPAPAPASFDLFDGPAAAPATTQTTGNLFDSHHTPTPVTANGPSLLDMNYQQPKQQEAAHADFLGMTATASPPVSGNYGTSPPVSGNYGMQQPPPPQQQQRPPPSRQHGSFDSFGNSSSGDAFGGLGTPWNK